MTGPLRPLREGARCSNRMHTGPRPPAAYLMTAGPCHAKSCRGALLCIGHPICAECGDRLRRGAAEWNEPGAVGEDVDVQVITNRGPGQRAAPEPTRPARRASGQ